jgi:hypothetical protein
VFLFARIFDFFIVNQVRPYVVDEYFKLHEMKKWYESQETVYLECPIEGLPKPNRTWYLDTKEISKNQINSVYELELDTNELSIKNFDESLQGAYICNGTNEFGSAIFVHHLELAGMYMFSKTVLCPPLLTFLNFSKYHLF